MENENFVKILWYSIGYFTACFIMYAATKLSNYLSSLPSEGVILSMNGTGSEDGEKRLTETLEKVEAPNE